MLTAHLNRAVAGFSCLGRARPGAKHGFTLIELLVVIAIIALLVSLLMPSLRTAKHLANQAVCAGNTHHIATALHIYADDWDGWVPDSRTWENISLTHFAYCPYDDNRHGYAHLGVLYEHKYIGDPQLLYCPGNENPKLKYPHGWEMPWKPTGYLYGVYGQMKGGRYPTRPKVNIGDVPPETALAADIFTGVNRGADDDVHIGRHTWSHLMVGPGINTVYVDGHAEFVPVAEHLYRMSLQIANMQGGYGVKMRDEFAWCFWRLLEGNPLPMDKYPN